MWYICIFSFKQWPCMCFIFQSSSACLRSSGKQQLKWVTRVGLVRSLPEHEDPMGPAEGSWWEVRKVRAWWGKKAIWSPLLALPVQDWYIALTVEIHLQVILTQAFLFPSQHQWCMEIPSFLPLGGPEIFCSSREETYRDQLTSAPSLQIQSKAAHKHLCGEISSSCKYTEIMLCPVVWTVKLLKSNSSAASFSLLSSSKSCCIHSVYCSSHPFLVTLATVAAACAPLWLLSIKSSSLINKQQHAQKYQPDDKGNWGKKPQQLIHKYDTEVGIRVRKIGRCPVGTACLIQVWGLGPKPEHDDLCHPDCVWLKVTGELVGKKQLKQPLAMRAGRGGILPALFSGEACIAAANEGNCAAAAVRGSGRSYTQQLLIYNPGLDTNWFFSLGQISQAPWVWFSTYKMAIIKVNYLEELLIS